MSPPYLAGWLIARATPDRRREELLGDLEELFQARFVDRGRSEARRWCWRQTANILGCLSLGRRQRRTIDRHWTGLLPARRAAALDPVTTLREE